MNSPGQSMNHSFYAALVVGGFVGGWSRSSRREMKKDDDDGAGAGGNEGEQCYRLRPCPDRGVGLEEAGVPSG